MSRNGFTLVELMVAIMVMALIAGAVMLTGGGDSGAVTRDAGALAARIAAAREAAITSSRPTSVWISASGYGFDRYAKGGWSPIPAREWRVRDWPEGTAVAATGLAAQEASVGGGAARLVFDNLGMPDSPAELRLTRGGREARVLLAANGDVEVR